MDFISYWQYSDMVTKSLFFVLLALSLISWVTGIRRVCCLTYHWEKQGICIVCISTGSLGRSHCLRDFDSIFSHILDQYMAAGDIYRGIAQILAITWVYRVHLNPDRFWTMGASAQSKYCLQGYAVCSTGTNIRYGDFRAAHRGRSDVVEDAGDDVDIVGVVAGKCEAKAGKKAPVNIMMPVSSRFLLTAYICHLLT